MVVEVVRLGGSGTDIWVLDLRQQTSIPLTTAGINIYPLWTPDQSRIAYSSDVASLGGFDGFWRPADGSGAPETILADEYTVHPAAWTADGNTLLYRHNRLSSRNLYATTLEDIQLL